MYLCFLDTFLLIGQELLNILNVNLFAIKYLISIHLLVIVLLSFSLVRSKPGRNGQSSNVSSKKFRTVANSQKIIVGKYLEPFTCNSSSDATEEHEVLHSSFKFVI